MTEPKLDLEWIRERTREQMPARRWAHTLGVTESAIELAHRYGADPAKAELAAILHDYAKFWPIEQQEEVLARTGILTEFDGYDRALLHSHAAAAIAREQFGIEDEEVLDAIRYHTSGRVGMTLLDKVVCLADYIEPGRDFPGVNRIRELAALGLNAALLAGFDSTLLFLIEKEKPIFPLTLAARNDLILGSRSDRLNQGGNE